MFSGTSVNDSDSSITAVLHEYIDTQTKNFVTAVNSMHVGLYSLSSLITFGAP